MYRPIAINRDPSGDMYNKLSYVLMVMTCFSPRIDRVKLSRLSALLFRDQR